MVKTLGHRIASILFLVLSCLVMIGSAQLKLNTVHNPGPGFMPFFLGLCLAIFAVLAFLFPGLSKHEALFWKDWRRSASTFYIFAGLTVYLFLLRVLGFYVDTFLLMFFLFTLSGEKGYKRPLLLSLLTLVITYLLFYRVLFIPFPKGVLGI
jgi:hypothetical protein